MSGAPRGEPAGATTPAGYPPGLAACRAILGGEADPFAQVWDRLDDRERAFWLSVSRESPRRAVDRWRDLPAAVRCVIKANLYRAARRADLLLKAGAAGGPAT